MGTVFFKFLIGGLAGLVAWLIVEPTRPAQYTPEWSAFEMHMTVALGAVVGLALGALDGAQRGGLRQGARGAILGAILGPIGAVEGYGLGGALAHQVSAVQPIDTAQATVWRIAALTPIGILLGLAIGLSSLNVRKAAMGLIGGTIGAAIGAALFDSLGKAVQYASLAAQGVPQGQVGEVGAMPRALFCTTMGALIGLFIGVVERIARTAWVRLSVGRNEGREWPLDSAQTIIGRGEWSQIPLFGDPGVAPTHAAIARHGDQYYLSDCGSGMGTFLNGAPVQQAPMNSGDHIRVGRFDLEFLLRSGRTPIRPPEAYIGASYPIGGQNAPPPGAAPQQPMPQQPFPSQQLPAQPSPMQPTIAYAGAAAARNWTLVAMDGPLSGQRFPIAGYTEVGRECAAIPMGFDTQASRRHASFSPAQAGLTANDLGSTNGLLVNGQRAASATLAPGDTVKIGATTFRVEV